FTCNQSPGFRIFVGTVLRTAESLPWALSWINTGGGVSREPTHAAGPFGVCRRVSVSECVVRWEGRTGGRYGGFAHACVCSIWARLIGVLQACGGGFPHGPSEPRAEMRH